MIGRFLTALAALALSLPILICSPATASAQVRATETQNTSEAIEGFPFPSSIKGLPRGRTLQFQEKGLGFSVRYGSDKLGWADIYICDRQKDLFSASSSDIAEEMSNTLKEILAMRQLGRYQKAFVVGASVGQKSAAAQLALKIDNVEHASFIFITAAQGKFVKIHYTVAQRKDAVKRANAFKDDYFARALKASPDKVRHDPRFI